MTKIMENNSCKKCSASFEVTDKDLEFYKKVSPKFGGEVFEIPSPTFCPDCRQQRRLSFQVDKTIYKRKCDATGENIVSMYNPESPYTVYSQKYWWSDDWDQLKTGKDFDFSRPFFEQFDELLKDAPLSCLNTTYSSMVNSEYNNACGHLKDCYLVFQADFNEDSCYCLGLNNSKKVFNTYRGNGLENSHECIDCSDSFGLFYCKDTTNSSESYFLDNCEGCKNCFLSANLVNKSYCILNKQYTKEEYDEKVKNILNNIDYNKVEELKKQLHNLTIKLPKKFSKTINCELSSGDYLLNAKDSENCYECVNTEKIKNCGNILDSKSCHDIDQFGFDLELCYEGLILGKGSYKNAFSSLLYGGVSDGYYSYLCLGKGKKLFGCVGLRNKSFCIFNKQYSEEEYNILVPKIIKHMQKTGEWGEFFPSTISPFGYNETVAQDFFPLDKNKIISDGFKFSNYEAPIPKVSKIIPASKLPQKISDIPDDILNWAIECEVSKKPFTIVKQELEFYRKNNLPIPRKHPDIRIEEKMKQRTPRKLFERNCDKCGINLKTTYSPEREEIVYCEDCYNKEIY